MHCAADVDAVVGGREGEQHAVQAAAVVGRRIGACRFALHLSIAAAIAASVAIASATATATATATNTPVSPAPALVCAAHVLPQHLGIGVEMGEVGSDGRGATWRKLSIEGREDTKGRSVI